MSRIVHIKGYKIKPNIHKFDNSVYKFLDDLSYGASARLLNSHHIKYEGTIYKPFITLITDSYMNSNDLSKLEIYITLEYFDELLPEYKTYGDDSSVYIKTNGDLDEIYRIAGYMVMHDCDVDTKLTKYTLFLNKTNYGYILNNTFVALKY